MAVYTVITKITSALEVVLATSIRCFTASQPREGKEGTARTQDYRHEDAHHTRAVAKRIN